MNRYLVLREHDGNKIGTVISLTPEIGTKRLKMGLVRMIEDGGARHVDVKRSDDGGIDFYSRNNGESVIKVTSDGVRGEDVSEIVNNINSLQNNINSLQATLANNRITTRSKVFGIEFDITNNNPACTRIADAAGLKNDFAIGSTFQLNGGTNDFDSIFPWCDIRLCNLSIVNGKKVITYEGETGFARDGSNGNVMVEVPKFYSMRERIGNIERWLITGEPKSGFSVEPAFLVDGKELDFVYVGAYNASTETGTGTGVFSYTDSKPKVMTKLSDWITAFNAAGYNPYDFSIFLMLQKLVTIEFATRNVKQYMGGIGAFGYSNSGYDVSNTAEGNVVVVPNASSIGRFNNLRVGHQIGVAASGSIANAILNHRTITDIVDDVANNTKTITFDGPALNIVAGTSKVFMMYQNNGRTDALTYHTAMESGENFTGAIKYRGIENPWGNVWEQCAGIRLKELQYYYTFDPAKYADVSAADWDVLTYPAPNQPYLYDDGQNRAWIVGQGFDVNDRLINLPTIVGATNGGGSDKYFAGAFYSQYDKDRQGNNLNTTIEYISVVGGAWDHYLGGGPFTIRMFIQADNKEWLYGNRMIYRSSVVAGDEQ